tara:strand:+ start:384 stop:635 length:252 start_codon:yes stop_codon:yes gene_type:complete
LHNTRLCQWKAGCSRNQGVLTDILADADACKEEKVFLSEKEKKPWYKPYVPDIKTIESVSPFRWTMDGLAGVQFRSKPTLQIS